MKADDRPLTADAVRALSDAELQLRLLEEAAALRAEVARAKEQLVELRAAALAFAYVACWSDPTLLHADTLELLRIEANRCRPEGAAELGPQLRKVEPWKQRS